jgi:hypothetical protein
MQEARNKAYTAKARINQKLAALPLEVKLGIQQLGEARMTTVNISNNTIANLNLGNVVGDLNGSIQQFDAGGQKELAEEIRTMSEAIGASKDLTGEAKKELLEHLSVGSAEAAQPPEKRKMGPFKASVEAIKSGIGVATQLASIWQAVEHASKAAKVIHG